jgi:hypothetical protein
MKAHAKYIGIFLIGMSVLASTAYSDTRRFQEEGEVTQVDFKAMRLSVGDSSYKLLPTTRVYSPAGAPMSLATISRHQHIKYNLTKLPNDRAISVTEIQILSK